MKTLPVTAKNKCHPLGVYRVHEIPKGLTMYHDQIVSIDGKYYAQNTSWSGHSQRYPIDLERFLNDKEYRFLVGTGA